ncbi:hypothetical protein SHAb15599_00033 [Acinetobacter phage SH-Ab 15599]|nr:hypothetical protein SHAb15599_00033 [Acinetobacter phage SH-Ab 15599]
MTDTKEQLAEAILAIKEDDQGVLDSNTTAALTGAITNRLDVALQKRKDDIRCDQLKGKFLGTDDIEG